MRNGAEFSMLDGMMVAISCVALTVGHPGLLFPSPGGVCIEKTVYGDPGGKILKLTWLLRNLVFPSNLKA